MNHPFERHVYVSDHAEGDDECDATRAEAECGQALAMRRSGWTRDVVDPRHEAGDRTTGRQRIQEKRGHGRTCQERVKSAQRPAQWAQQAGKRVEGT